MRWLLILVMVGCGAKVERTEPQAAATFKLHNGRERDFWSDCVARCQVSYTSEACADAADLAVMQLRRR